MKDLVRAFRAAMRSSRVGHDSEDAGRLHNHRADGVCGRARRNIPGPYLAGNRQGGGPVLSKVPLPLSHLLTVFGTPDLFSG
jgi:hypothetical protein